MTPTQYQIWNSIVDALDCLTAVAGEMKTGADMMSKLFRASLTGVTVGKIPTCTDEVTIGSADLIRPDNCKCAILLGCSEGEFPAAVSESGLFSGSEITELEEIGIELMRGIAEQASDEQLYFYTAACAPSDKLTLTYSDMSDDGRQQKPSIGLKKILAAIPALKTVKFHNMPLEEKLRTDSPLLNWQHQIPAPVYLKKYSRFYRRTENSKGGFPASVLRSAVKPSVSENILPTPCFRTVSVSAQQI